MNVMNFYNLCLSLINRLLKIHEVRIMSHVLQLERERKSLN